MLKIRLQGTTRDIKWFRKISERDKRIKVLEISEPFANKGTNKYFRVYACCKRNELEPMVTLHHFSSPAWIITKGGWESIF